MRHALLTILLALSGCSLAAAADRPNVLFISVDDLNDWVGAAAGHPQAKTPNMDRLIARSTFFSNAHCTAPVCSASRHSLLSGLRPSTTGWYTNSSKSMKRYQRILGETIPLPTHFKRSGYRTMAAGKVFHKGVTDIADYDYWDETRPKYRWPRELAARGHGYQGKSGGHFHPFPPDGGAIYQKYQRGLSGQSLCWGALGKEDMPAEGMPDHQIARWAVQRLQKQYDKPFFMAVGFVRPHVPFTAPKRFFNLYDLDKIVMPRVPERELADIPLVGKAMALGTLPDGDHWNVLDIGSHYWPEMVRAYLACVSFADHQVGLVLDALDASPHAQNTIVVLWSDHGQHLGEKKHWRKQSLWEESTRVPLAFRLPGKQAMAQRVDAPVSLLDIYPTLIDLCQLKSVPGLEGHSVQPLLANPASSWPHAAITTWYYKNHSIRTQRWRYIRYRDGGEELYDHDADPLEHDNLAGQTEYATIIKQLRKRLPGKNVLPAGDKQWEGDSLTRKIKSLQTDGIPAWLR